MPDPTQTTTDRQEWRALVKPYRQPSTRKSLTQVAVTLVLFIALWTATYHSLEVSYLLTLALSVVTGAITVRFFIFSHDCGHGSFFKSRRLNDVVGFFTGVLAYTPYLQWRASHARHHARSGQIEERGVGYFWTMTVKEFEESSRKTQIGYRLYRHPAVLFSVGGIWCFLMDYRFAAKGVTKEVRNQVYLQNTIYLLAFGVLGHFLGYGNVAAIQLPMAVVSATGGLWLFHVQHHYEDAYWSPKDDWSYEDAAFKGSSYLKLDPVSQWFAGNINFHHVHHLAPGIPNYRLQEAHEALEIFQECPVLTVGQAISSYRYTMIDEASNRWVGFKHEPATAEDPLVPLIEPQRQEAPTTSA